MDNQFDFKSLTNDEEEKIIRRGSMYIPGIIILSLVPLLSRMVMENQGTNPVLFAALMAFGPAIFTLSIVMFVQMWQRKPLELKKIYKLPALVFYLIFLIVGYQTIFTIDRDKKEKIQNEQQQP